MGGGEECAVVPVFLQKNVKKRSLFVVFPCAKLKTDFKLLVLEFAVVIVPRSSIAASAEQKLQFAVRTISFPSSIFSFEKF